MYVVLGATGNTGRVITEQLLKAGKKVRAVARGKEKLATLEKLGAEVLVGDLTDERLLTRAFTGATAVYGLVPPNLTATDVRSYQVQTAKTIATALGNTHVKHLMFLSSIGAQLPQKGGIVQGLHDAENNFNKLPNLNVLHLRPGYFMENLVGQIAGLKQAGVLGSVIRGDLKFPLVATRDIADYAAKRLVALDWKSNTHQYLLGARDVSYNEIATIVGKALGKPDLKYTQAPSPQAREMMIKAWGVSPSVADAYVEFQESLNSGKVLEPVKRDAQSTTPTSLEQFLPTLERVWKA